MPARQDQFREPEPPRAGARPTIGQLLDDARTPPVAPPGDGARPRRSAGSASPLDARGRPGLTVMLADDSVLFRDGLAGMLTDHGCTIAASVGTGEALLQHVAEAPPDAVILDVRMPPGHATEGIDTAIEVRARFVETPEFLEKD